LAEQIRAGRLDSSPPPSACFVEAAEAWRGCEGVFADVIERAEAGTRAPRAAVRLRAGRADRPCHGRERLRAHARPGDRPARLDGARALSSRTFSLRLLQNAGARPDRMVLGERQQNGVKSTDHRTCISS